MRLPVLEVGGTHVSAAVVDADGWRVVESMRLDLDADASAEALLARFREAAGSVDAPGGAAWGVAMPDPFDYSAGVALFEGVGKFGLLRGVDVGAALRSALRAQVAFVNDADAFTLGEWAAGAAVGVPRCAGMTLGTGVGSGWVVDGRVVDPGYPPGGRIHRMAVGGRPLEDVVSRRAIRAAYAAAGGDPAADVREITEDARAGDDRACRVIDAAMTSLGDVVGRCLARFHADVLVVGGSMAASWDLFGPAFAAGAEQSGLPPVQVAAHAERSPLIGAAVHATRS